MSSSSGSIAAVAIDLGTTRVKSVAIDASGATLANVAFDAPEQRGDGRIRESDPDAWVELAARSIAALDPRGDAPLALSTQRSSFLLFRTTDGRAATPLISWQDRRASEWCDAHRAIEPRFRALSGLVLSPHYAAPKLATLFELDRSLAPRLARGELGFATLDAWILRGLDGRARTDLGMAARTGLVDLSTGDWSDELCATFGVPRAALPTIEFGVASSRRVRAHLADQAAGALAHFGEFELGALVNLGTGGFVLVACGERARRVDGYLVGPIVARDSAPVRFALEGTINGGGATAARFASGPTAWSDVDPTPNEFCLPDENGIGAPYWRADRSLAFSSASTECSGADRRRIVLEGIVFRVRQILDDLVGRDSRAPLRLSGGLARDPFVPRALAAVLDRPIVVLEEFDASLVAVARLAAGLDARVPNSARRVEPSEGDARLAAKYPRWRAWVDELLAR